MLAAVTFAIVASACSAAQIPARDGLSALEAAQSAPSREFLYVGSRSGITQYDVTNGKLVRTIRGSDGPLAFDRSGNLYASLGSCIGAAACIGVYAPGMATPERRFNETALGQSVTAMAFHGSDALYVTNGGPNHGEQFGDVTAYEPESGRLVRAIVNTINGPTGFAFDRSGNLYVCNAGGGVGVYAPSGSTPVRTIAMPRGEHPAALAFDASDNLYVASVPQDRSMPGSIREYAPGGSEPVLTIARGIFQADGLAFDGVGNLYVSNAGAARRGWVSVYVAGSSHELRRIDPPSANTPSGLALDSTGRLYVTWSRNAFVGVYAAQSTTLIRSIESGIESFPAAPVIGPR